MGVRERPCRGTYRWPPTAKSSALYRLGVPEIAGSQVVPSTPPLQVGHRDASASAAKLMRTLWRSVQGGTAQCQSVPAVILDIGSLVGRAQAREEQRTGFLAFACSESAQRAPNRVPANSVAVRSHQRRIAHSDGSRQDAIWEMTRKAVCKQACPWALKGRSARQ